MAVVGMLLRVRNRAARLSASGIRSAITSNLRLLNSSSALSNNTDNFFNLIFVSPDQTYPTCSGGSGGSGVGTSPLAALAARESSKQTGQKQDLKVLGLSGSPGTGGGGLWVHVLSGKDNYTCEKPGYPRQILNGGGTTGFTNPTVAVGNINFSAYMSVVVGGNLGSNMQVFAFKPDGGDVPGYPTNSLDPPFFNAMAVLEASFSPPSPSRIVLDGLPRIIGADESTCMQRWNSVGRLRQAQRVATDVISSVELADVGQRNMQVADGVPDEVGAGLTNPYLVRAFDSWVKTIDDGFFPCSIDPAVDLLFSLGLNFGFETYSSSAAIAELDHDPISPPLVPYPTQDIAILNGENHKLQVFASHDGLQEYSLPAANCPPTCPQIGKRDYGSPAIADLDGNANPDGSPIVKLDTIVIGTDSGRIIALRYDPILNPHLRVRWSKQFDMGAPISASPVVALLWQGRDPNHPYRPQIVFANDAGIVHVLEVFNQPDGTEDVREMPGSPYPLLPGADAGKPTFSTPAVWTRKVDATGLTCYDDNDPMMIATNCPIVTTGNLNGIYEVVLTGYPAFDPALQANQWPTFHRSNTRTGALVPSQDGSWPSNPQWGSIGGVANGACRNGEVKLYKMVGGNPVPFPDYYTGDSPAHEQPLLPEDGRYVFEHLDAPADYQVWFLGNQAFALNTHVDKGILSIVNRDNCP